MNIDSKMSAQTNICILYILHIYITYIYYIYITYIYKIANFLKLFANFFTCEIINQNVRSM